VKADAAQLRRALASPSPDTRLYLFHGPDEAGAQAAAAQLARSLGDRIERVDLDGAALRKEPSRAADEAASLSLFGDTRLIRIANAGEESVEAMTLLLAAERAGNPVVAIAPSVRTTAKLVKLAIESPRALAHGFYEPSPAEAEKIAATLAREHGLTPDTGVARRIADAAGGDRAVIEREVEKLALFLDAAPDRPRGLDNAALDALGADMEDVALDELVNAFVDGVPAALGQSLARIGAGGASPVPWLRAVTRRLLSLATMRAEIDAGEPPAAVMKRHRVFFREEAATLATLRRWSPAMLARGVAQVRAAERATMATGNAGTVLADAAALAIAQAISRRR
jgi:DNA polymerase-3 subunit delta